MTVFLQSRTTGSEQAKEIVNLLRIRQWAKNVFVLAPLFFASQLFNAPAMFRGISAFVIFCLVSSAVYIFNDWRDIEADRRHAKKWARPLASGVISVHMAFTLMALLLIAAAAIGFYTAMPSNFWIVVATYIVLNLMYSAGLKQISVLELFLVSSGFLLRLLAGGFAIDVELSSWIVAATFMVALLLATAKRRGDIAQKNDVTVSRKSLAKYNLAYLDAVLSTLVGATLVVYLLFCVSDHAAGRFGQLVLLTAVPVAFGLLRYLQLVMVGGDGDSPTDLVLGDPGMLATLTTFILIFAILIYW